MVLPVLTAMAPLMSYHNELQRREHSNYQEDTVESMDRKQSNKNNAGA